MGFFEVYQLMLKHFGKDKIKGIRCEWSFGDILDHYIKNREKGLSKEEAAFRTPEGYVAKGNDFTVAEVDELRNAKGEILRVHVKFKRQKK
jgi:hypothetical protein